MIAIHHTRPAGAAGRWLQKILEPVAEACRFDNPPPIEIRPTGDWRGWCEPTSYAADGRICLSNRIIFWSKQSIISIYLHESAHRLLACYPDVWNHGPVFFALNSLLVSRSRSFFDLDHQFPQMSFYDLQDRPPEFVNFQNWQEMCLRFARETLTILGQKQCSAEQLAAEAVAAWPKFVDKIEAEFKRDESNAQKLQDFPFISKNYEKRIRELKLWWMAALVFWLMTFWLPVWMFFKLAAR